MERGIDMRFLSLDLVPDPCSDDGRIEEACAVDPARVEEVGAHATRVDDERLRSRALFRPFLVEVPCELRLSRFRHAVDGFVRTDLPRGRRGDDDEVVGELRHAIEVSHHAQEALDRDVDESIDVSCLLVDEVPFQVCRRQVEEIADIEELIRQEPLHESLDVRVVFDLERFAPHGQSSQVHRACLVRRLTGDDRRDPVSERAFCERVSETLRGTNNERVHRFSERRGGTTLSRAQNILISPILFIVKGFFSDNSRQVSENTYK